jgi:hypothetical protein
MAEDFRDTHSTSSSVEARRAEIVKEALRQSESCLWTSTTLFTWLRQVRFQRQIFVAAPVIFGALAGFSVLKDAAPAWLIALLALVASLFPALADALKIATSVDETSRLAAEYKALQDRFRRLARITSLGDVDKAEADLADLMDRMDVARSTSITPPQKYFDAAREQIEGGPTTSPLTSQPEMLRQPVTGAEASTPCAPGSGQTARFRQNQVGRQAGQRPSCDRLSGETDVTADDDWLDVDIRALSLSDGEKAGLQIYRNYTKKFEGHALSEFRKDLNKDTLQVDDLTRLLGLIEKEDARSLPVIVCAYADDQLKAMFKKTLPDGIPGGKDTMFGAYGPLSDFAKRIRLAYAFDSLSRDLLTDLDRVRAVRNDISHTWDISALGDVSSRGRLTELPPIEKLLPQRPDLAGLLPQHLSALVSFRIRLAWIVARLVYEVWAYDRAKKRRLDPQMALYGMPSESKWLEEVASLSMAATTRILKSEQVRA